MADCPAWSFCRWSKTRPQGEGGIVQSVECPILMNRMPSNWSCQGSSKGMHVWHDIKSVKSSTLRTLFRFRTSKTRIKTKHAPSEIPSNKMVGHCGLTAGWTQRSRCSMWCRHRRDSRISWGWIHIRFPRHAEK
jgi:hypothetical protein